ncbi:hypothetical protein PUN28_002663 [Cardiocondyla obscurior]|uniref:Uncharacterized protein n=1 Tax=Cardiocondyla obscurior TaxID=286306 RepID=A0AAW2GVL9_9HYME
MLQEFFSSINSQSFQAIRNGEVYQKDIKGLVRVGKRTRGGEEGGGESSSYGIYQNAVGNYVGKFVGPRTSRGTQASGVCDFDTIETLVFTYWQPKTCDKEKDFRLMKKDAGRCKFSSATIFKQRLSTNW